MKYEIVQGDDIQREAQFIDEKIGENNEIVFVYVHPTKPLHAYIDALDRKGKLSGESQYKLKICYEKKGLDLTYKSQEASGNRMVKVTSMSQLVGLLNPDHCCQIIVNSNERSVLAEVVQQMIYISYPLSKAEIMLQKDARDHERAERFMAQIDMLDEKLKAAVVNLDKIEAVNRPDIQETLDSVKDSCRIIQKQMEHAKNRQLKIAVAASKKTGKSVIVNSMIGEELAPTSLELATPNSCIYKKSDDGKYYLNYKGKKKHYISAAELHEEIGDEFKKAQEEVSNKFTLSDMEIGYVSDKNNFETYTIYDTPGPDAAGTGHGEKAMEAMEQVDVAIFAIDYTKYLTTTEEQYLYQIKELFNEKQKFDSLIFTINKIDQRYIDADTSKSVIKSIDLIRGRLMKIDACYRDCAIFATSALQYFYAIEAEKECGDELRDSKDLYVDIRPLSTKYKNVRDQLSFLDGQVGNMSISSGISDITLEDLKHSSGMSDLLEYTSYIAKTKARDELVNSVAYQIDLQWNMLRTKIDRVENIRMLMGESSERIQEITKIFNEFDEQVNNVLRSDITQEDIEEIGGSGECRLNMYWKVIKERDGKDFTFKEIRNEEMEGIEKFFADFFNPIKQGNLVDLFFDQMRNECWEYFQNIKDNNEIVYKLNEWLTEEKVEEVARRIRDNVLKRAQDRSNIQNLEYLNDECEKILQNRSEKLANCIENCEKKLRKMDYEYIMPTIPNFTFSASESEVQNADFESMNNVHMEKMEDNLKGLYKRPNVFKRLKDDFQNHSWKKEKFEAGSVTEDEFKDIFLKSRNEMRDIVAEIALDKYIESDKERLKKNVEERVNEIDEYFNTTLAMLAGNITLFTNSIDDREKYKENIEKLEEEESMIRQINEATNDFMSLWEKISSDETGCQTN